MKDVLIGTLSGISAAIAMALLMPRPQPAALPVRELAWVDSRYDELGRDFLPATRPDPVRRKLETTVAQVDVKEMPVDKLVAYLAELTGANFYVDWRALESAGIDSHSTVTLNLQGVPVSVVLNAALRDLGGGNIALGYHVQQGVVEISTMDSLARDTSTRIYDVRDLLEQEVARSRKEADDPEMTESEATDGLSRMLQEAVDPTTWRDAGGSIGGFRAFAGRLIITQTPENHEQVLGLLSALRRMDARPATQGTTK
jgi:hypothetical protein